MNQPEFDRYSASYLDLLKDPVRDFFAGKEPGFFQTRKRDLIRDYFRNKRIDPTGHDFLDIGCGKGELLSLLSHDFASCAGCDPSPAMIRSTQGFDLQVQSGLGGVPFDDARFNFVTAVCVYHHVPPAHRLGLTREAYRVLKPGGVFGIIEHNPLNPATRLIVGRTPVDANAVLLSASETCRWMRMAGFHIDQLRYFLYVPQFAYRRIGRKIESWLGKIPFGGQYALFGIKAITHND